MDNRLTNTYHIFDKSKLIAEYTRYIFKYGNNKIGYSIKNYHNIFYKIVVFIVFLFLILTLLISISFISKFSNNLVTKKKIDAVISNLIIKIIEF